MSSATELAEEELIATLGVIRSQRERIERSMSEQKLDYPDPNLSRALVQLANAVGGLVKEARQVDKLRRGEEMTDPEVRVALLGAGYLTPDLAVKFIAAARRGRSKAAIEATKSLPKEWNPPQ